MTWVYEVQLSQLLPNYRVTVLRTCIDSLGSAQLPTHPTPPQDVRGSAMDRRPTALRTINRHTQQRSTKFQSETPAISKAEVQHWSQRVEPRNLSHRMSGTPLALDFVFPLRQMHLTSPQIPGHSNRPCTIRTASQTFFPSDLRVHTKLTP